MQAVVKALDCVSVQLLQPDGSNCRLDVVVDVLGVAEHRVGLNVTQVIPHPDVQPLSHGQFAGVMVVVVVQGAANRVQFLVYFLFRFTVDTLSDFFARARVNTYDNSAL